MKANCVAGNQTVEAPGYYSLLPQATRHNPDNLKQLKAWLANSGRVESTVA